MFQSDDFPSECSNLIFSFLELSDCLRVCSTSLLMMKEILPTLCKRRLRTKERYSYVIKRQEISAGIYMETKEIGALHIMEEKYPHLKHYTIPTVEDQLAELSRTIPISHPQSLIVRELRNHLSAEIDHDNLFFLAPFFTKLFPVFKRIVNPLKLYIKLLSKVITTDPFSENAGDGRISLDRYIGDVLCMTYLFTFGSPNLAELSTSISNILEEIRSGRNKISSYMSWVMLHSSILRTKRFTQIGRAHV